MSAKKKTAKSGTKRGPVKSLVVVGVNVYACPKPSGAAGVKQLVCKKVAKGAYIDVLFNSIHVVVTGNKKTAYAAADKAIAAGTMFLGPRTYKVSGQFISFSKNAHLSKTLDRPRDCVADLAMDVAHKIRKSLETQGYTVAVRGY